MNPTFAVQLTGPGRGAVATVLLDGPDAAAIVGESFRSITKNANHWASNRTFFGRWAWQEYEEELVVCRTGLHRFEVHCHGGRLASGKVLASMIDSGAIAISPDEWLRQEETDRFVLDAKSLLPKIKTERALGVVLDQIRGAMRPQLLEILDLLRKQAYRDAELAVRQLVQYGELGVHLAKPFRIVLVGSPNTGKSSLINAIVGFQRAVVYDQPGTTRDLVSVETAIAGWPFVFTDTAGVRRSEDPIEQEGIRLAREVLSEADLMLEVCDLSSPQTQIDLPANLMASTKKIVVGTKVDLAGSVNHPVDVVTSARTGQGVSNLLELVVETVVPGSPEPGAAVPLSRPVFEEISEVRAMLSVSQWDSAIHRISELLL